MATPTTYNGFEISTNATFNEVLTYYQSNGTTPVNLTGYTAMMAIKNISSTLLVELTTTNGYITLGGTAGTITLNVPKAITSTFTAGTYYYDLVLVSGSVWTRLITGQIVVLPGITLS